MKGGADIYDQQEIRRYVEGGGSDAVLISRRFQITQECAQSWIDHYSGKEKPKPVVEDEWEIKPEKEDQEEQEEAAVISKK